MKQTAGRNQLSGFADKFAELNDDVLFGEIWSREGQLNLKTRCIVTLSVLIGKGIVDNSLKYHLENAKSHGVSKSEIAEIITHAAFYAGWPNGWAVFNLAKEVYKDEKDETNHGGFFGLGELNVAYSKYFIGKSYLKTLVKNEKFSISNVTFEPGCRNNWHIHNAKKGGGQVLLCIEGEGYYQEENKEVRLLKEGDVVVIPPNVKHWHGARGNNYFSHLAIEVPGEQTSNSWLEPVDDKYYDKIEKSFLYKE